ncbi:MAG: sigma-70 family RNA polymerase sigma factor [Myxococcota bacterium]
MQYGNGDQVMDQAGDTSVLLERARSGDEAALEQLLRAVQPQLYRFSMKMCRHTEDAEDVLQDSLMTLARSFQDFRGASSLSTWLFTIARSFCIKKRRKSAFAPEREESLEQLSMAEQAQLRSRALDPHEEAESAEIWRQVQAGIQRIALTYREVLVLRDIEGLAAKEVAEVVGISVSAVKSRLHRARAELRVHLAATPYRPQAGCPDIRTVFSQHLEGDLSPDVCSTMEAHVARCLPCAAECEGLRSALNACSTATCEVPAAVQLRVKEALRQALEQRGS